MKRWILLSSIVGMSVAAMVYSQHRKVDTNADASPLLFLVADTEQELTRMPARFTRMSDEEEIQIGDEMAKSYSSDWEKRESNEDREIDSYLNQVGGRLAAHAHRQLPYRFHFVPGKYSTNAFALPGGHVFVGKGLIALMDSEDELAAVIGHELEHIDHYHCAERVQQQEALRKVPLGGLIALPIAVFEAGYSKDQELEADREGTRLAVAAGYSANGAIRMFETFQRLYEEYHTRAKTPQQELSNVAQQALEGYFRSHPSAAERISQIQILIADEHWQLQAERELAVAYILWRDRASDALHAGKYALAEQMAARSLKMRPAQPRALRVLAQAQFAQANFAAAAASFRALLDLGHPQAEIVEEYATALAAADPHTAASMFRDWMNSIPGSTLDLRVPLAGLSLVAGDDGLARNIAASATSLTGPQSPVWLAELGWWYYKAGDYSIALGLLSRAYQQRPGDIHTTVQFAWAEIEEHRLADALQTLSVIQYDAGAPGEQGMARAVCRWQAGQKDEALPSFRFAVNSGPEWDNPRWVKALYSPLVAQSVLEMKGEEERRRNLQAAAHR